MCNIVTMIKCANHYQRLKPDSGSKGALLKPCQVFLFGAMAGSQVLPRNYVGSNPTCSTRVLRFISGVANILRCKSVCRIYTPVIPQNFTPFFLRLSERNRSRNWDLCFKGIRDDLKAPSDAYWLSRGIQGN